MTSYILFCGFLGMVFLFPFALAVPKALRMVRVSPDTVEKVDLGVRNMLAVILVVYILFLGIGQTLMK